MDSREFPLARGRTFFRVGEAAANDDGQERWVAIHGNGTEIYRTARMTLSMAESWAGAPPEGFWGDVVRATPEEMQQPPFSERLREQLSALER